MTLKNLIDRLGILVSEDRGSLKNILEAMKNRNLLPGDTLIAIIVKHYDINTILTFDEDFKRIPWQKVVPSSPGSSATITLVDGGQIWFTIRTRGVATPSP